MVYEGLDPCGPTPDPRVQALRAAYRKRRLVVSRDPGALARARGQDGHAIDARDVAEVMLAELIQISGGRLPV